MSAAASLLPAVGCHNVAFEAAVATVQAFLQGVSLAQGMRSQYAHPY
jgi:hypothetical protein